jgi:hypothetical protein
MSLVKTLNLLSRARQYVEQGEECLLRQRAIVELLELRGHDPLDAILFLEILEEMQDAYAAHMDSLERKVLTLVRPE